MKSRYLTMLSVLAIASSAALANDNSARNNASACNSCHGTNGNSIGGMEPLAGLPKNKLITNMKEFRAGAKTATVMHQLAKGYTDAQIEAIADFYAAQK